MKKIILFFLSFILIFHFTEAKLCSDDLILHQNLRAPKKGYLKNGQYDWYTKGIVKEVKILQKHLQRFGLYHGRIDGIIGPKTRQAILELQKKIGTKVDGYVGPKTRKLLNHSCDEDLKISDKPENIDLKDLNFVLWKGERGEEVLKLQKFLKNQGWLLEPDGVFGPKTEKIVEEFNLKKIGERLKYFNPRFYQDDKKKEMKIYLGSGEVYWDFFDKNLGVGKVLCNEKEKEILEKEGKGYFLVSNPDQKTIKCQLVLTNGEKIDYLKIYPRTIKYPKVFVKLVKRYSGKPNPKILERIKREKEELKEAYQKADPRIKFNSSFINPIDSQIISPFGKKRIFNNGQVSVHSGTDFRARTPTPVKAINDGVVIWANKDLYYCGKGIIINHGMNLFSIYCHLSENKVKVGEKVNKGEVIGISGATGRVSGPHLHLGIKYQGRYIDFRELKEVSEILK